MKRWLPILIVVGAQTVAAQTDPRARIFVERGCTDCHAVAALKLVASTDAGPDLTEAYADVPQRYGLSLERFLHEPVGVMRLVWNGPIQLSSAQRDSLVSILRAVYWERLARGQIERHQRGNHEYDRPSAIRDSRRRR
jgi:hypothetical protein